MNGVIELLVTRILRGEEFFVRDCGLRKSSNEKSGHWRERLFNGKSGESTRTLVVRATHVGSRLDIDLDLVTDIDERGNLNFSSGFGGGGLRHIRGRIPTHCGVGHGDFQNHLLRRGDANQLVIPEHESTRRVFFDVGHLFFADILGEFDLLETLVIHEDVVGAIAVREAPFSRPNVSRFQAFPAAVSDFQIPPGEQIPHAGLVESLALAGLYELASRHFEGLGVDDNFDTFAEIASVHLSHGIFSASGERATGAATNRAG